ncbi:hypothetical protein SAMN04487928_11035 [Butyrivibrio proteoclasticus]|uniref:Uncharacterized protein n=1 Tax=Butyrivibrio proteoclasticus TaxID=43305 RepID=A0A1I5TUS2_9FIRM|nr:hypothetical protein [Butyrivibrio proteoclasticus]SFP86783.1 hypothetical protein SAMN04487928_11035 [Butyrivibrio proteoclasticus]
MRTYSAEQILNFDKKKISSFSREELNEIREIISPISVRGDVDPAKGRAARRVVDMIDDEISKIDWKNKEIGYPKHSEGGWYL